MRPTQSYLIAKQGNDMTVNPLSIIWFTMALTINMIQKKKKTSTTRN